MTSEDVSLYAMTAERVDPAFPLAREVDRDLSLEAWREFAQPLVAPTIDHTSPPGILLAMRNDYIRGLAAYEIHESADAARSLVVDRVAIVGRTREHQMSFVILGGLLDIAQQSGCEQVCAELSASSSWLQRRWSDPRGSVFRLPVKCFTRPETHERQTPAARTGIVNFRARN